MIKHLILFLLLLPSLAFAAPTISNITGTVTKNNPLVLTGTDLGVSPTVYKFDDFEDTVDHVVGADVGTGPGSYAWKFPYTTHGKVSNTNTRTGSTQHGRSDIQLPIWGSGIYFDPDFNLTTLFVDFFYRFDSAGDDISLNNKPNWFAADDDKTPSQPRISMTGLNTSWKFTVDPQEGDEDTTTSQYCTMPLEHNWVKMQFYGVESTAGGFDGTVIIKYQTVENGTINTPINKVGNIQTRNAEADHWEASYFGNYANCTDNPGTVHYIYDYDDIYIASSQARVVIGNAATFINCTHLEIQGTFSAWSTTEITFIFKQGSFSDGETVYAYIIDTAGLVNTVGYAITITGGTTPDTIETVIDGSKTALIDGSKEVLIGN